MDDQGDLLVEIKLLKSQLANVQSNISLLSERNARVELEKKWETSVTRFVCITIITYLTMNLILWTIGGPFPPVHAIVPTFGYVLSTLSLGKIKNLWKLNCVGR